MRGSLHARRYSRVPSAEALSHITISLVRIDVRASTFSTFCLKRSTRLCVTTTIRDHEATVCYAATQCNRATDRVLSWGHECRESRSSALRRPASRRSRDGFRRRRESRHFTSTTCTGVPTCTAMPEHEWDALLDQLVSRPTWIIDGNFTASLPRRLAAADTVILLDLPRIVCLVAAVKRRLLFRVRRPPGMARGCPPMFNRTLVGWIWSFPDDHTPYYLELLREAGAGANSARAAPPPRRPPVRARGRGARAGVTPRSPLAKNGGVLCQDGSVCGDEFDDLEVPRESLAHVRARGGRQRRDCVLRTGRSGRQAHRHRTTFVPHHSWRSRATSPSW